MKNYLCKKCYTHIENSSFPSIGGCPKGGHHEWVDLGEVGNINYQCKKCALLVQSKSLPSIGGCSSGGHHEWKKL